MSRVLVLVFFYIYVVHRFLHSFPTRRSSDLPHGLFNLAAWVWAPRLGMRRTLWTASARDWEATATPDSITGDRKSTRLNSSLQIISYAVFCLKKKNI